MKTFSGQASQIGKAMLSSTESGLASLVQVLDQDGQGLQDQAQNYQETDRGLASTFKSGSNR